MVGFRDISRGHRAARKIEGNYANINRADSGSTAQESAITIAAPSGINDHSFSRAPSPLPRLRGSTTIRSPLWLETTFSTPGWFREPSGVPANESSNHPILANRRLMMRHASVDHL